ncbi:hypothetical protein DFJ66_2458 [Saccharothrix variisporea]|uniref:Uncharacterized protein n=1 Tax=Saccharothrix variisporea TaxID=543527 RepID=A0A495XCJ4_9PSEU|nr:hypothetical protein DFJ66_2458 [Saccharothrix variisporea]
MASKHLTGQPAKVNNAAADGPSLTFCQVCG